METSRKAGRPADQPLRAKLLSLIKDVRPRSITAGLLSRVPGLFAYWDRQRQMGNSTSAEYCRSIWRFHLENSYQGAGHAMPRVVAELGPGATLGACIAALLDGVSLAIALDAGKYATKDANLQVLKELSRLEATAADLVVLNEVVSAAGELGMESRLRYAAPWSGSAVCLPGAVDLIFSHSVLEHVADPASTYLACHSWMKPGGLMSHKIDHSSHGLTRSWNGHYAIPEALWKIIFGKRPFLLNRMAPRQHIAAMHSAGFELLPATRFRIDDGGDQRTINLAALPDDDRLVRTTTILARKPV